MHALQRTWHNTKFNINVNCAARPRTVERSSVSHFCTMTDRLKKLFNSAFGTCVRHNNHILLKQAMCTVNWTAVLYNNLHLIITNVTHKTLLPIQITWLPFMKIKSQITLLSGDSQYYSSAKIRAYTILSLTSGKCLMQ